MLPTTAIYLSPHYDDICFSLGMTARAGGGGHLINIFTDCNYAAASPAAADVAALRDAEDRAFAANCALTRHSLGLPEATVLGLSPFDLHGIDSEVDLVEKQLLTLLPGLAATEIYCPLGVGRHRNHISVFLAVMKSYKLLTERSKIFFYEDLPYASRADTRREAIQRLVYYFPPEKVVRHANQLTPGEMDDKIALVSLYKSQHHGPVARADFTPAEPSAPFAHEAFWEAAA